MDHYSRSRACLGGAGGKIDLGSVLFTFRKSPGASIEKKVGE